MDNTSHTDLLDKIEAFCAQRGMTPSDFGRSAVNDANFVFDLRKGRDLRMKTYARVLSFMDEGSKAGAA